MATDRRAYWREYHEARKSDPEYMERKRARAREQKRRQFGHKPRPKGTLCRFCGDRHVLSCPNRPAKPAPRAKPRPAPVRARPIVKRETPAVPVKPAPPPTPITPKEPWVPKPVCEWEPHLDKQAERTFPLN